MKKSEEYKIFHFSQALPSDADQTDLPRLLKTVGESLEELGRPQVSDIVLHYELRPDGIEAPSVTVYYDHN